MSTILKSAIKPGLNNDILSALRSQINEDVAKQQEAFAEDLAEAIAQRVSVAVQNYLRTNVQVQTQVVVAPGIVVATTGTPAAQTGTTTSPGTGTGTGILVVVDPPAQSNQ